MAGKPNATIDWKAVDGYLRAGCDGTSIAGLLGIHPNTLYNNVKEKYGCNFSEYAQRKRGEGIHLVEKSIFDDAISKGGIDRIFWLKNKAGWKDKVEQTVKIPGFKIVAANEEERDKIQSALGDIITNHDEHASQ
jgi:hypothetical protein